MHKNSPVTPQEGGRGDGGKDSRREGGREVGREGVRERRREGGKK